jgi:ATP-dependent RNA helicase DDX51/DBP6
MNFTLQHLRFLVRERHTILTMTENVNDIQVIDEADRLLAQSFQEWLAQVLAAIQPPPRNLSVPGKDPSRSNGSETANSEDMLTHDALAPAWTHTHPLISDIPTDLDDDKQISCQKLLFSATLTRDPSKIAAIGLKDPKYFVVQGAGADADAEKPEDHPMLLEESFAMPATLKVRTINSDIGLRLNG